MSQSTTVLPLSEDERVQVRRFCGYPAFGSGDQSFQAYRFWQAYGLLEFRLTNMADSELTQTRAYISDIQTLETAVTGASDNLDTDQAAVWKHNKEEVQDRVRLFNWKRRQLCIFLGIPPHGDLAGNGAALRV